MRFYSPSHTQQLSCQGDSKCALAVRESPCVDKLSEVMHKTHPYLQTAANSSSVTVFSRSDWHNLYSMAHCLRDLWTQRTPAIAGAFGHWYHLVSLALNLAHTILFLTDWSIRSCLRAPWREMEWSLWLVICRRSWCRCRDPSWHGLL